MPHLTHEGDVAVLDLGDDENRWSYRWMQEVDALVDRVLGADRTALVTTARGRVFSNGLDLEWLQANPTEFQAYLSDVHHLLAKFLTLGVPTIAAVQGHAFGAGALLALAHDQRVMRADRGWWCLPEVELRMPFTPGMAALVQARLTPQVAHIAMTTARRYGGLEAQAAGIVDRVAEDGQVSNVAVDLAHPLVGADQGTLQRIKQGMYGHVVDALHQRTDGQPGPR